MLVYLTLAAVRLMDGGAKTEGRVEVYMEGSWGTVCNDGFDDVDASVICRQLGYLGGVARSASSTFGIGKLNMPVWLRDLDCTGTEDNIMQCPRGQEVRCFHSEDVAVICQSGTYLIIHFEMFL